MTDMMVTTYSMWSLFRNCRKACEWRYIMELVPQKTAHSLSFGALIHNCLETWHNTRDLACVLDIIDRAYINRAQEPEQKRDWHLATALLKGYAAYYNKEDFDVIALEKTFEGSIINPATGAPSRSFVLAGKVDGIVRIEQEYFLLEHKTASYINADYLERLWTDFQIILYSHYVEQTLGLRISGVIYNILVKARLQQPFGETQAEFEARRAELLSKSKTGKSHAKRKQPESDEAFQSRLLAKYAEPGMFHREMLYLSRDRLSMLQHELWELTQAFLDARRRGVFYQNTGYCFHYGRPCPYFALCRSDANPNVIDNFYEHRPAHEELRESESSSVEGPVF